MGGHSFSHPLLWSLFFPLVAKPPLPSLSPQAALGEMTYESDAAERLRSEASGITCHVTCDP